MEATKADDMARGAALMKGNWMITRMCLYGFLKNLKFFEPYFVTVMLSWGLSLAEVGILLSIEKIINYTFELPSGYLADRWGLRRELCACFVLYILSFICFFFGESSFAVLALASVCFGMGEALRSGTHKAMVFLWLERNDLLTLKSFLNGKTRSYSLLGSALAALGGIGFMLFFTKDKGQSERTATDDDSGIFQTKYIFLMSIPPYLIDLCIIASYPSYMDFKSKKKSKDSQKEMDKVISPDIIKHENLTAEEKKASLTAPAQVVIHTAPDGSSPIVAVAPAPATATSHSSSGFCSDMRALLGVLQSTKKRTALLSSSALCAAHRLLKDFVQPVVVVYAASLYGGSGTVEKTEETEGEAPVKESEEGLSLGATVLLGTAYCLFYLCSAPASRKAHALGHCLSPARAIELLVVAYAVLAALLGGMLLLADGERGADTEWVAVVAAGLCLPVYVVYNLFKPLAAARVSDLAGKRLRATVLSGDALLQTGIVALLAPVVGWAADHYSLAAPFLAVACLLALAGPILGLTFRASLCGYCCYRDRSGGGEASEGT